MTNDDEGKIIARGRNFLMSDETYLNLKIIAAEKSTTIDGAVSFLINNYKKNEALPVKKFGRKKKE